MTIRILTIFVFCAIAFSAFAQTPGAQTPATIEVAVPTHDIARGAKIAESDLTYQAVAASRAGSNIMRSIPDMIGKEARRALRDGELIRESDLKRPTLVAKGSTVTMLFEVPGMTLTAVGRAITEGGQGESITVLNPTSYRQVEATVVAPGTVRVGSPHARAAKALAQVQ
jgi:flagella basal body P-ring formation protein FlgA